MFTIFDKVFTRKMMTRKDIDAVSSKVLDGKKLKDYTFEDCRDIVYAYGIAKNKRDRGAAIVKLATIGFTGVYHAKDIAKILLDFEPTAAVGKALDAIYDLECQYKRNMRDERILRKGAKMVLPKGWKVDFETSAYNVKMYILPPKHKSIFRIGVDGAGNICVFIKMLFRVLPLLAKRGIALDHDTMETIVHVWDMGESHIAYGQRGWTGKEMVESDHKSCHDYLGEYDLPDDIKAIVLDYLQDGIAEVKHGVGNDFEGNTYNGLAYKPIPEHGLWW